MITLASKLVLVFALALLPQLVMTSEDPDPSPCLPTSSYRTNMLRHYQFVDTTTDSLTSIVRSGLNLPVEPVAQIVAVDDTALCRRGVTAYNYIMASDSMPATIAVYLIKYGSTRYIIGDPSHTGGEYRLEAIVDSSFAELAIAGR